jgi:hypothetical protein
MSSDLGRELEFWSCVEVLDRIAGILSDSPDFDNVLAEVQEHRPDLTPFEAKARVVESDPRGGPELAALLRDQRREVGP